jgi:hypothetical protein
MKVSIVLIKNSTVNIAETIDAELNALTRRITRSRDEGMDAVVIVFGESQTYKFSLPVTDTEANNIASKVMQSITPVEPTYIAPVEDTDVQDALRDVLDQSVSEEIAQSVLDNYIEPTSITAPRGCTGDEEAHHVKQGLIAQLTPNKEEISDYIDDLYAAVEL